MKCEACRIWIIWGIVFSITIAGFFIAYLFVPPPPPKEVSIATGRVGGGYHTFALEYQKLLKQEGIELKITPTAGSIEVLNLLETGKVSVGFVQGGTAQNVSKEELSSLASVFYEPVWVFHRKEQPIIYLQELKGKRIAIGEKGSGTRPLALRLLEANDIKAENTTFVEVSSKEGAKQLIAGDIDAAFFVTSPMASLISELLENPEIELLSFKRHLAYSSRYNFLTSITIGEGLVSLENNIPDEDKILLAATASIVARNDTHPALVRLLLKQIVKTHKDGGILEKKNEFPSDHHVEIPMSVEASRYLEKGPSWVENVFPFWLASMVDRLKILLIPLLTLMIPLFKSAFPIYRWRIRSQIYRWYKTLREADLTMSCCDINQIETEIAKITELRDEIVRQVSVPLPYMGEFYTLRVHINLVLNRLEEQRKCLQP